MTLLSEMHMGVGQSWGFSNYFLAHVPKGDEEECKKDVRCLLFKLKKNTQVFQIFQNNNKTNTFKNNMKYE